jgi:hypothetical protein
MQSSIIIKIVSTFLLLTLIIISILFALYNTLDIKNSWFNPEAENKKINFELFYPPPEASMVRINSSQPNVALQIKLFYNGTMVEGQPVLMSVIGSISMDAKQISSVNIGFEGATPYSPEGDVWGTPNYGVTLEPTEKQIPLAFSYGTTLAGKSALLVWQVQGDYRPSIIIHYVNRTIEPTVYQYMSYHLHIDNAGVLKQERYNRINWLMTVAIFLFTIIESFAIIKRLWDKKSVVGQIPKNPSNNNEKGTDNQKEQTNKPNNSWNRRFRKHEKKRLRKQPPSYNS